MLVSQWAYRFRGYLITLPLIFAFFCYRWEIEVETFVWPLGIYLVLAGMILRIWAQQHLHYRLKVRKHLTTTGPYSFVRNPMYIGNALICIGGTIISELLWLAPITFLYCLCLYSLVVRYEESHLLSKYGGSYRRYLGEVPRWVPSMSDMRRAGLKSLGLRNEYFRYSIYAEIHCLLILLPYLFKEIL